MAEKLTPQQAMAVHNRGGKLLVSAAAGSGKTKVLVDRLLSYLLDPVNPANLDEFLIITYTKAAASELRGKIASKLSEKMAENPENKHLQRQMQRLYLTKISTVHAFCGDILREYAYLLDLPGDFRVADENECRQLLDECMARCLDAAYEDANDPDFRQFVDSQGLGRDDRLVPEIILKVYESARCHLDPAKWLRSCIDNADTNGCTDAAQTLWGSYLMGNLKENLRLQISALSQCATAAEVTDEMAKPALLLRDTIIQLQRLVNAESWDEVVANRNIDYGRLTISKKCPNQELGEQIKAVRNACKKSVEKLLKSFADPSEVVLADLRQSSGAVRGMVKLAEAFGKEYSKAKRAYRILDFGDLEHSMLDLLLGKSRGGLTGAAKEIGRRFREIMVDEYQDSNAVQDAIFAALTNERQNCFMVGDVKQSIYQFRLADPGIFLEKYNTYQNAEEAVGTEGRRIMLSHNFRSGSAVLSAVNDVFAACMSPSVGGLHYGEDEALREGIAHTELGEQEVELWAIDVQESTYTEEADFVAQRIAQLTDGTHMIRQGDGLRPILPDDIAILLRSPGSVGSYFKQALESRGIRCSSGGGDDLLQSQEISVLRALLQTISNPRQDIPLLACLASPIFCLSADDLAQIRSNHRSQSIYDSLLASDMPKVKAFLTSLDSWRRAARLQSLSQLLESIFLQTGLEGIYAAMPNGDLRRKNLQTFYQLAISFEATARRDLEQFLSHLDALEEKGLIVAGEQTAVGAVTMMSIHKSKGLEFPVVFVCGLSRQFNRESVRAQVLCEQELGLGLMSIDEKNRVRYPTIAKRAIASKITSDSLSEEMRVLYVALTRARDRLIMTYASQTLAEDIREIALRMDVGDRELLTRDVVCSGEWVLTTALRHTEAGELFSLGGKPENTELGQPQWLIRVGNSTPPSRRKEILDDGEASMPTHILPLIEKSLSFKYPYAEATVTPSKQTATQRKGRAKDVEIAQNTQDDRTYTSYGHISYTPTKNAGADLGTATHAVMQYIRYDRCNSVESVLQEVERIAQANFITAEQASLVDCGQIAAFFATELGQQLQKHPNVLREFKFSILEESLNSHADGDEILLQGVVDCAMVDDDGVTVIDFKTDYVTEETLEQKVLQYRPQIAAYTDAMSRIYERPVKASWLYFFRLNRFIQL